MTTLATLSAGAVLAAAVALPAYGRIDRTVEKTFSVQPGGTVHVETFGGGIDVKTDPSATQVKIVATESIRASTEAEADDVLKSVALNPAQDGQTVTATAEYHRDHSWFTFGGPPVRVAFAVTVPEKFNAELATSGGNIAVGDLDGAVRARTSGGDISLGRISGSVDAGTSGGSIRLAGGGQKVILASSGGSITCGPCAGAVQVRTSGGDIALHGVEGPVTAHTSGGDVDAAFAGALRGDCALGTSGGRVRVKVPAGVAYTLDAATSGGSVQTIGVNLAAEEGRPSPSHLRAPVNGGGPVLRLRSSGGDIQIATGAASGA